MITRSKQNNSEKKEVFQIAKEGSPQNKINKPRRKPKSPRGFYITPFDGRDINSNIPLDNNETIFSPENLEKIKLTSGDFKGQIFNESVANTNSKLDEANKHLNGNLKLKKKREVALWSTDEEISFLSIILIFKLFKRKITMRTLHSLIMSKTLKQLTSHYQSHKKVVDEFANFFFYYFNCEKINNVNIVEFTLEELFIIFKNNILDKNFTAYFNENMQSKRCIKFFQKIYSYIIFEPKYIITNSANVHLNNDDSNKGLTLQENNITPLMKCSPSKNSNGSKVNFSKFKSSSSNPSDRSNQGSNISKSNKPNLQSYNSQLIREIVNSNYNSSKYKNMRIKVESSIYEKFQNFSSDAKNLIVDDNFIIQFLISQFKSNSSKQSSAESKK